VRQRGLQQNADTQVTAGNKLLPDNARRKADAKEGSVAIAPIPNVGAGIKGAGGCAGVYKREAYLVVAEFGDAQVIKIGTQFEEPPAPTCQIITPTACYKGAEVPGQIVTSNYPQAIVAELMVVGKVVEQSILTQLYR